MAKNLERRDFAGLAIIRLFLQVLLWATIIGVGLFKDCYYQGQLVRCTKEGLHREWRSMGFKYNEWGCSKQRIRSCLQPIIFKNCYK